MQIRLKITTLFFVLVFLALVARLFYWQVYKGKSLSVEARSQYESGFTIGDREILRDVVNNYLTQHESGNKYGELNPMDIYRLGSLNGAFELLARQ